MGEGTAVSIIHDWVAQWGFPAIAALDLMDRLGEGYAPENGDTDTVGMSETAVSNIVRLAAARAGILLWRNNVGAFQDDSGRAVRYGLCNDSKALNQRIKSGDLIGIKPVTITASMIGQRIGQFVSYEIKAGDWQYTGTAHELAQVKWRDIILSNGGDAKFTTGSI